MPIHDADIDLTVENKLGGRRVTGFNTLGDIIYAKLKALPWKNRPLQSGDFQKRYKRKCGDRFSDDIECTVRRTLNGSWFFAGEQPKYFDDYLYEYGVLRQGSLVVNCCHCGRLHLTVNEYQQCERCDFNSREYKIKKKLFPKREFHRYIPWKDAHRDWQTREFYHPDYIR